jgi:xanthine dehydrogenase accessory factor
MKVRIPGPVEVLAETERTLRGVRRVVLCHILRTGGSTSGKPGWRLLVRPDGSTFGNLGGGAFEAMVTADARARLATGVAPRLERGDETKDETKDETGDRGTRERTRGSEVKRYYLTERAVRGEPTGMACGGFAEVLLEVLEAKPVLVICGGGPVGQALAEAAAVAGFELVVADDRAEFRRPEFFPEDTARVAVDRDYEPESSTPGDGGWLAPWSERELYVAVVSRCWETDTSALASVLRQEPPHLVYLGLMGSRRKIERVTAELAKRGLDPRLALDPAVFHAPVGLPLGGGTPGEIAISITAELIRCRYRVSEATSDSARSSRSDERVETEATLETAVGATSSSESATR